MFKLICGKNSVLDAIENKMNLKVIYLIKEPTFRTHNIETKIISKEEMDNMTTINHQGFIAILNDFEYHNIESIFEDKAAIVLILDHLQDPQNLGSILRTANASGIYHIIIPNARSADINSTVLRVASGGIVGLKIIKVSSIHSTILKLKKQQFWIYSTSLNEQSITYEEANYNFPLAIIIGNEDKGISKSLLKEVDQNIYISMLGTVQSLNVSVATGIILFYLKNVKEKNGTNIKNSGDNVQK